MGLAPDMSTSAAATLAQALNVRGIQLSVATGGGLLVVPASALTPEDREGIRALKVELLTLLAAGVPGGLDAGVPGVVETRPAKPKTSKKASKAMQQTQAGEVYRLLTGLRRHGVTVRAVGGDRLVASPARLVAPWQLKSLKRLRRSVLSLLPFMLSADEIRLSRETMRIEGRRWLQANYRNGDWTQGRPVR